MTGPGIEFATEAPQELPDVLAERRFGRLAWLLIVVLVAWLLGPWLLARGMFLDGMVYGTISRNLAVGIGDFWHPLYTDGRPAGFYDHPPLAFGLQSLVFRLIGDQFWVERVYSALTAPCLMVVIGLLWRIRNAGASSPVGGWFPILLWMTIPTWSWMYRNNIQENTLAPLAALSVYASLRLHQTRNSRSPWGWAALAAAAMLCAALTKGPVGLFPAITPLVAGICFRDQSWKVVLRNQLLLLALFGIMLASLCAYEPARHNLLAYGRQQVVASLAGERGALGGRLYLVERTITALGIPLGIAILLWVWGRRRSGDSRPKPTGQRPATLFYLLTALSASIPLLVSPRQAGMYAAPSYPYYVLALAVLAAPGIERLITRFSSWLASDWNFGRTCAGLGTLLILAGVVSLVRYGTITRDAALFQDVAEIADQVAPGSSIAWPTGMQIEWQLEAYLYRLHYISLSPSDSLATPFALVPQSARDLGQDPPATRTDLNEYRLYVRAPNGPKSR